TSAVERGAGRSAGGAASARHLPVVAPADLRTRTDRAGYASGLGAHHGVETDRKRGVARRSFGAHWIQHAPVIAMSTIPVSPELSSVSAEQWEQARRRLSVVRELIDNPNRIRAQVI